VDEIRRRIERLLLLRLIPSGEIILPGIPHHHIYRNSARPVEACGRKTSKTTPLPVGPSFSCTFVRKRETWVDRAEQCCDTVDRRDPRL
jgi:hypothetical protein